MELGEWRAAVVDPVAPRGHAATSDDARSPAPPDPDEWRRVTVPQSPAEFAGANAVAYRTTFFDPRDANDATTGTRALVELEGLYAHARVWINGEYAGSHDAYFAPARFAFEPRVANEVLVVCRRPEGRFGGALDTALVASEDAVPGIRWGARVRTVPRNFIADLSLCARESEDEAWIDATVTLDAGADLEDRVALSLSAEGFEGGSAMTQVGANADAGERVAVTGRLPVRDPARWWPRGFGDQHRYGVTASLGASQRTATTGFVNHEYDENGLVVNDTRVPVRGIETRPCSLDSDPTEVIDHALAANASLVRPHAHVPSEAFYEACDETGLLVWQPLPYCVGAFDVERGRAVARRLGEYHGHRPSLAAFGMFDAPEQFFAGEDSTREQPSEFGRLASQRARPTTAKTGTKRAETAESKTPGAATPDSEAATSEATRGWRVRRALGDITHGAAAAAVVSALPEERPTLSAPGLPGTAHRYPAWERSESGDNADSSPVSWVLDGRGYLADVPVLRRCEIMNPEHSTPPSESDADTLATVIETLRRAHTDLLTVFSLHGASHRTDESGPQDVLAEAFEPVQAFLDDSMDGLTGVTVLNDTPEQITGRLDWTAGERTGTIEVAVAALTHESVGELTVPESTDRVELSLVWGEQTVTNHYHR